MAPELGKIEKPEASQYTGKRKLLLVPLLYSRNEAPSELIEKLERYWEAVSGQIGNLEKQLGVICRVYHENIFSSGKEGISMLEKINPEAHKMLSGKDEANLQATEDMELTQESSDWERCLMVSGGQRVRDKVSEFYLESSRKRYEHIAQTIDNTLKEGETGILFIQESHRVQFPKDVEVFNIYPPVLDEIYRWLRDYSGEISEEKENSSEDKEESSNESQD